MQVSDLASMMAPEATSTSPTSSATSSTDTNSLTDPNLFITLLTAQLQAQDPTNPMSPEDMVTQLTEVSSLQQLISINQTLTNLTTANVPAAASQAATTATNPRSAIQ
jgi:flagellar basal-body rod modification protein FlgD